MAYSYSEVEGKRAHDPLAVGIAVKSAKCIWVAGPIIVGAGPSGLAAAACLKQRGVPSVILERSNCIASLWKNRTYDRLRLHLPKQFCELPLMPFPKNFPTYPTKQQFVAYLDTYVSRFDLKPVFGTTVVSAEFDPICRFWRVKTSSGTKCLDFEYTSRWLIVATGENAEAFLPKLEGMDDFRGPVLHTSEYKSGDMFCGKRVLVVGCGNSGMEVCLDLCNHNAQPSLVVRDSVHILPQEMLGRSTFGLSMCFLKWFPAHIVDRLLLLVSHFMIGDTAKYGLIRPKLGPLQLKNKTGKTPVLDVGTLSHIKSGKIKVFRGIKRVRHDSVEFVDEKEEKFDAIILATGYRSNVPSWLMDTDMFSKEDGFPKEQFPHTWKGKDGLYAIGFNKRGLLGASMDAWRIAEDIELMWKAETKRFTDLTRAVA
ncbi:indole-3-pyruvate monooxygenase YUCCA2-like [Punica granatum]|uniref:Flavin-containing monooxygenase n=2 Tax=Punica granatum TaxID=22663 RepID=A0A218XZ38_PUNGR|nr:indole-3-pyruvate monooxygenase YUCCA2-like [Punica granatum]OWM89906.1 hypothetical protein CDL15_Pgr012543 [Punica granatum]PKI60290.1 hypothetical protein CRG98_019345 [Punica granatum]